MFKFIARLFTKRNNKMLSNNELSSFQTNLKVIERRLLEEIEKSDNSELSLSFSAMQKSITTSLEFLEIIKKVQKKENERVKKFKNFKS